MERAAEPQIKRYEASRRKAITVVESLRAGIPTRELPDLRESLTDLIRKDLKLWGGGVEFAQ